MGYSIATIMFYTNQMTSFSIKTPFISFAYRIVLAINLHKEWCSDLLTKLNPTPRCIRVAYSSEGWKSEVRVSAWLSSDEDPLLGCGLLTSGCFLLWQRAQRATVVNHCVCWLFFGSEIQGHADKSLCGRVGVRLSYSDGCTQISKLKKKHCSPWLLREEICPSLKEN